MTMDEIEAIYTCCCDVRSDHPMINAHDNQCAIFKRLIEVAKAAKAYKEAEFGFDGEEADDLEKAFNDLEAE